jgi:cytochrome c oxidase accessory protein FixG
VSNADDNLLQPEEHVLSTLEADGKRRWLYPRLSQGKHWYRRRALAWGLIAFFTIVPWLRYQGLPVIQLDIVNRRFILLGETFLPTDTLPVALLIISLFLIVFFLTAVLGRVWCGWACPQTVYLEFVFRPIQRVFFGRAGVGGKPKKNIAGWRYVAMYAVYLVICAHLANTALAYFVNTDNLTNWIWTSSPAAHPMAFLIFVGITGFMMFDFAYWREQFCIIGCPYGRFQSVMLDRQSLIISYDEKRGEPRGKPRKGKGPRGRGAEGPSEDVSLPVVPEVGDCIDCDTCVQVCPTGIDIREGLQMECVACAQCIDACNDIMDRMKRPRGLIRYSSQDAMEGKPVRLLRPRVVLYPLAVVALLAGVVAFLITRPGADVEVLRTLGRPFAVLADGTVDNPLRVKVTNRTDGPRRYAFTLPTRSEGELVVNPPTLELGPEQTATPTVRILLPTDAFTGGRMQTTLRIADDRGERYDHVVNLRGPTSRPTDPEGASP